MSELTLLVLRIGFLLLLWFFIFGIVYALRSDLFGAPVRRLKSGDGPGSGSGAAQVSAVVAAAPQAPPAPQPPPTPLRDSGIAPGDALPSAGGALPSAAGAGPARHLVITSGVADGTSIALDEDLITIGRSSDSTLVIVDDYTSTYHARLSRSGDQWILTDLDSTNGTRLDGERITKPVVVPPFTPVTIGTTTFELRP
ncbi:FHA domain-containing protein FhaB/FipA [Leucobacter massiliensis]|uniref:FHA domain-containing protein n=1 Tax=Leucobacter massiliensis TaxID=1686285 RepID=A0A2S9QRZ0_9MICO|nr:FHA domain-containing protein [Leucobacter massiliensis]PRI12354.1 FHA domain-containing protein [Leucobacter massiliensis]